SVMPEWVPCLALRPRWCGSSAAPGSPARRARGGDTRRCPARRRSGWPRRPPVRRTGAPPRPARSGSSSPAPRRGSAPRPGQPAASVRPSRCRYRPCGGPGQRRARRSTRRSLAGCLRIRYAEVLRMLTTDFIAGSPNWIDLGSPDVAASAAFYTALFGWEFQDAGPEAGGYGFFSFGGKTVGAAGQLEEG